MTSKPAFVQKMVTYLVHDVERGLEMLQVHIARWKERNGIRTRLKG
ncbi:MAG: hypothetical protein HQM12_18485 [SAR324 cluster bacterium]|nr:hypothetical protein [SAR324 cluster bacterium]